MITPEIFRRNEQMRQELVKALDVLEIAFAAADYEEDESSLNVSPHDALAYSMAHARRTGITKYKALIRSMAQVPAETIQPLEASYLGVTPFDQLALDAEREHQESLVKSKSKKPKTK